MQIAIWDSNELEFLESEVTMEITYFSFDFFGPFFCGHPPPPSTPSHFTSYISWPRKDISDDVNRRCEKVDEKKVGSHSIPDLTLFATNVPLLDSLKT